MTTRLILDTDLDTDCDDAGAMAVLHALANRGGSWREKRIAKEASGTIP